MFAHATNSTAALSPYAREAPRLAWELRKANGRRRPRCELACIPAVKTKKWGAGKLDHVSQVLCRWSKLDVRVFFSRECITRVGGGIYFPANHPGGGVHVALPLQFDGIRLLEQHCIGTRRGESIRGAHDGQVNLFRGENATEISWHWKCFGNVRSVRGAWTKFRR